MTRFVAVLAVGVLSLGGIAASAQTSTTDKKPAAMQMNEKDFVAMMLQHHQDGIEMSRVAEQKATSPEVKALAKKIREGQEREAREMKPFAGTGAATPRGTSGQQAQDHQAHAQQHQAHMEQSKKAIERVRSATGKAVDVAFLEEMTKHHEMAIQMTRDTRFDTTRLKQMADKMVASQTTEIGELKRTRQRVS